MTGSGEVTKLLARGMAWAAEARDTVCLLIVEVGSADEGSATISARPSDLVLGKMGERLVAVSGPLDTILPLGADRFAMILVSTGDADRPVHVANKVLATVREFGGRAGGRLLTASIGAACSALGGSDPSLLVRRAESALSQAKDAGRNLMFAGSLPPMAPQSCLLPST